MLGPQGDGARDGEQVAGPEVGELLEDRVGGDELPDRVAELAVEEQEQPAPGEGDHRDEQTRSQANRQVRSSRVRFTIGSASVAIGVVLEERLLEARRLDGQVLQGRRGDRAHERPHLAKEGRGGAVSADLEIAQGPR